MNKARVCNQEVYEEVAEELGLSEAEVKSVIEEGQSKYTAELIKSSTFDSVRWPYFGIFQAKPKLVQIINHMRGLNKFQQKEFLASLRKGDVYRELNEELKKNEAIKSKGSRTRNK